MRNDLLAPFCLLAILGTVLSQVFRQECFIEMPESVWVPVPLLGLLELPHSVSMFF